ncbi:MAG: CHC2 zinc finger domain-containing protein [Ruthenibacterium sp.]
MKLSETIKETVTMCAIFERYGFQKNHSGFISCPFHSEKTASLGTFQQDTRWKCFGCGAGGDVFSFVMKLFDISFAQAVLRIGADFGLSDTGETHAELAAWRIKKDRESKELAQYRAEWQAHLQRFAAYDAALIWCKPIAICEPILPSYLEAMNNIDNEWDWLVCHPWK